jgi:hypothetical protein
MKKSALVLGAVVSFAVYPAAAQTVQVSPPPPDLPPPPPAAAPAAAVPAPAAPPPAQKSFGNAGTLAFAASTSLDVGYHGKSPATGPHVDNFSVVVSPNVQYFVIDGLSLGGVVSVGYGTSAPSSGTVQGSVSGTRFAVGPTVGYDLWLVRGLLSVWPQATFLFESVHTSVEAAPAIGATAAAPPPTTTSNTIMNVGVFVPFLLHPVRHFFFGVGPYFNADVYSKTTSGGTTGNGDENLNVGLAGQIGGWL